MSMISKQTPALSDELVMSKIYTVRNHKVMLDSDLAELYEVPTKALIYLINDREELAEDVARFHPI